MNASGTILQEKHTAEASELYMAFELGEKNWKLALGDGVTLGPILLGAAKPMHILTPSATVRRIVNMTALTVVDCNVERQAQG